MEHNIPDPEQRDLAGIRVTSIDALRGFTMFWIIGGGTIFRNLDGILNHPVTAFLSKQLTHVKWLGFHFEDLIMPLFIFVVGLAVPFSISNRLQRGQSRRRVYFHIIKRTAVLYLLGVMLGSGGLHFNWPEMDWVGILQRIAVCYFFAAILVMHTKWQTQAIVAGVILLLYWAALALVPVPGHGAGVITPAGCLPAYMDQQLLPGKIHEDFYGYGDSNGILPTVASISTVLLGVLTSHWLRSNRPGRQKVAGLALAGLMSLSVGYVWGQIFPIIRLLWTSSMAMFAAGLSLLLLALFYWLIDVKGYKKWAFGFVVIGMNAIAVFTASRVFPAHRIGRIFVGGLSKWCGEWNGLVNAVAGLAVIWLVLWWMYRKKTFIKI
ncbi:acyltransferase family protein [Planctomycetota bacterium]